MTTVIVEVTQQDIDLGVRACGWRCAVALAIRLALKLAGEQVYVDPKGIELFTTHGTRLVQLPTPPAAVAFIEAYDAEEEVGPFSFELVVPERVAA